ncbi:MAG: hypothetical protein GX774_13175 [Armatimonadetes bacterium]|nr:hypothetical protein [Armatimonadota bacterium]
MATEAERAEQIQTLTAEAHAAGPAPAVPARPSITRRAILTAVVLTFLTGFWVRETEIYEIGVFVSESVPTMPAVAALLLLLGLNALLRRRGGAFHRGEILFVFLFVTVATTCYCCGMVRILLAFVTAPFYFAQTGNRLAEAGKLLPNWAAVHDPEVVRGLYESVHGAGVPWGHWLVPAVVWTGFFLALWVTTGCLILLMHRPWIEQEKLAFPMLQLPLELVGSDPRARGLSAFLRNPVMWAGFALSFLSDGGHILHALVPSFPLFGREASFTPFSEPPWNAVGTVHLHRRPFLIGFGYLVSSEISFSIWATFWLEKLAAVALSALGYREGGAPHTQAQGLGAYLAIALGLLYLNRRHLLGIARAALGLGGPPEARAGRFAFWGFLGSLFAVLLFARLLGLAWWAGVLYFGILLAVALTFARLRAEAGIPLNWLIPYGMPKAMLVATLGSAPFSPGGDPRCLTALAMLSFLSYALPMSLAGYQVESLRLGRHLPERPGRIFAVLTLALLVGLLLSFVFHLAGYYHKGSQQVYGGLYGAGMAVNEYSTAITSATSPLPPDKPRVAAVGAGFLITLGLQAIRSRVVGFPLHPLGFAASNAYGHLLWMPFLLVWLIKGIVLRVGGMALYRKTVPGFLGFALGHFFTSGVVWGGLGALSKRLFEGYIVCFG